ncbi:hypothetical protein Q1695_014023 [Nippostrongylus brasiliensis]|nr:hypothetical protein Q1695_014023 [Nippostrongylus brasiliensis]
MKLRKVIVDRRGRARVRSNSAAEHPFHDQSQPTDLLPPLIEMVLILCITLISAVSAVLSFFRKSKKEVKIQKDDWKRDVVYLYQFPRSKAVPCLSTYCMKVETFLRANKIPHEWGRFRLPGSNSTAEAPSICRCRRVFVTQLGRSKYGLLPFVELNGEHIADSQIILNRLVEHFNVKPLPSPRDEAMARAVGRMCENHTSMLHYKFKVVENPSNNYTNIALEDMGCASWLIPFAAPLFSKFLRSKASKRIKVSLGDFSVEDCKNLLKKDYDAYRDLLGDRKFLFGDEVTVADCSLFSQLASTIYLPVENYAKDLLKERYPTLVAYTERVKEATFGSEFAQE